jgi:hypothetical protein
MGYEGHRGMGGEGISWVREERGSIANKRDVRKKNHVVSLFPVLRSEM